MASFSVTVTSNTIPAIVITMSGNTTYAQFKNSLGQFVYNIKKVYLASSNQSQISSALNYSKYDSSGNQNLQSILPVIDPYQDQNTLFLDTSKKNAIIDGRDYVRFSMLPNVSLQFKIYCDRITNQDELNELALNNFKSLEQASGDYDFFEEYVDIL